MNYIFKDNTIIIKNTEMFLSQKNNSFTRKPFLNVEDAENWLTRYFRWQGELLNIIIIPNGQETTIETENREELNDVQCIIEVIDYDTNIPKIRHQLSYKEINNFKLPKLDDGTYYIDLKVPNYLCLFNKETNGFEIKNSIEPSGITETIDEQEPPLIQDAIQKVGE